MTKQNTGPGPSLSGIQAELSGAACIANISQGERMKRLLAGIIPFVLGVVILAWLMSINADRLWRLLLFFPFLLAGTGYFQWADKTCVALSSRGTRNLSGAEEKIEDENELTQVRLQARHVRNKALLVAVILTLLAQVV